MKNSLILIAVLLITGCATSGMSVERTTEVRNWIRTEVIKIYDKQDAAEQMYLDSKITLEEYSTLMELYKEEKRTIPSRVPF